MMIEKRQKKLAQIEEENILKRQHQHEIMTKFAVKEDERLYKKKEAERLASEVQDQNQTHAILKKRKMEKL